MGSYEGKEVKVTR